MASSSYMNRGRCRPMETLTRTNTFTPNPGDQTSPGTQTLTAERTALGIVIARATIKGRPVAFTNLRSTYFHEVDSAAGFADFNDPAEGNCPRTFQKAASKIGYTFNWFYTDPRHIAYFNSGANPVRPKHLDYDVPVRGLQRYEWRGYDPTTHAARFTTFKQHPQAIDQKYLISWNNKQAKGYRGTDDNVYSSVYRSINLEDRLKPTIRGRRRIRLAKLIDVMEMAGSMDLRAHADLPLALKIIGTPKDKALRPAMRELRAWLKAGGLRRDQNRDGVYEHSDAVRIMAAWWPRWIGAQFRPRLGRTALGRLERTAPIDNPPNGHGAHLGSSYQGPWFGYVRKDLRTLMGRRVKGRYGKVYCGKGSLKRCRAALESSLKAAVATPASTLYSGDEVCQKAGKDGDQACYDSI